MSAKGTTSATTAVAALGLSSHADTSNDFHKLGSYFQAVDVIVHKLAGAVGISVIKPGTTTDENGKKETVSVLKTIAEITEELAATAADKFVPGSGAAITEITTDIASLWDEVEKVRSALKGTAPAGG